MKSIASLAATVTAIGLFSGTGTAQAQSNEHIDRLALRVQRQAQYLQTQVRTSCGYTPQYRHLEYDVAEMVRAAAHLHEAAHCGGNSVHLRADVRRLNRLYHHVEEEVDQLVYSGTADPSSIASIRRRLAGLGQTLYHLREDVDHRW